MRDIPFNCVMFGTYETAKYCVETIVGLWEKRDGGNDGSGGKRDAGDITGAAKVPEKVELGPVGLVICGGLGGMGGWAVVFPFDVVKSRLQTRSRTLLFCRA